MDQPTNLEITITGKAEDVKRAALASQRRIDLDTRGFEENSYIFGDGSDFQVKMDEAMVLGSYDFNEHEDGNAEYSTEQDSYRQRGRQIDSSQKLTFRFVNEKEYITVLNLRKEVDSCAES